MPSFFPLLIVNTRDCSEPLVPITSDPAKLAIYAADGLVAGQPFPGNIIPANLMDQNAVLQLNTGAFPKPNFNNGTQYIASIPQPTNVREDIVRIDHSITSKYQLMGHYLHDTLAQNYFPPLWGNSSYPTVGTEMNNPSYSAVIKLTTSVSWTAQPSRAHARETDDTCGNTVTRSAPKTLMSVAPTP